MWDFSWRAILWLNLCRLYVGYAVRVCSLSVSLFRRTRSSNLVPVLYLAVVGPGDRLFLSCVFFLEAPCLQAEAAVHYSTHFVCLNSHEERSLYLIMQISCSLLIWNHFRFVVFCSINMEAIPRKLFLCGNRNSVDSILLATYFQHCAAYLWRKSFSGSWVKKKLFPQTFINTMFNGLFHFYLYFYSFFPHVSQRDFCLLLSI